MGDDDASLQHVPLVAETATVQYEDWQIADDFAAYGRDFNAAPTDVATENDKLDETGWFLATCF